MLTQANIGKHNLYESSAEAQLKVCIEELLSQWPTSEPSLRTRDSAYFDFVTVKKEARSLFHEWVSNLTFKGYINSIQEIIDIAQPRQHQLKYLLPQPTCNYQALRHHITFTDLLNKPPPADLAAFQKSTDGLINIFAPHQVTDLNPAGLLDSTEDNKLTNLLGTLKDKAVGTYERVYIDDLHGSCTAFKKNATAQTVLGLKKVDIEDAKDAAGARVTSIFENICSHLEAPVNPGEELCYQASISPRLSPGIVLAHIASSSSLLQNEDWKSIIVQYGISITKLQRAERLLKCFDKKVDLLEELKNPGHHDWDPLNYPDWLLLELENNILIRPDQAQVAKEMISPSAGGNSIMQLNMGLGKSSVIVPVVSATLADKKKLARVVVLKSLSTQMHHLLVNKLGGMINRPIYFIPISRSLKMSVELAGRIQQIYSDCKRFGGILLVQPEHLLSFELLGLDKMMGNSVDKQVGEIMVKTQSKFHSVPPPHNPLFRNLVSRFCTVVYGTTKVIALFQLRYSRKSEIWMLKRNSFARFNVFEQRLKLYPIALYANGEARNGQSPCI